MGIANPDTTDRLSQIFDRSLKNFGRIRMDLNQITNDVIHEELIRVLDATLKSGEFNNNLEKLSFSNLGWFFNGLEYTLWVNVPDENYHYVYEMLIDVQLEMNDRLPNYNLSFDFLVTRVSDGIEIPTNYHKSSGTA